MRTMLGKQLRPADRLLIRLIQTHRLVAVEKLLECVDIQRRLKEDGVDRNLAMIVKDQGLIPRRRLKALARGVKFNLQRNRDKVWAQRLVADGIVGLEEVGRCLARQLQLWETSFDIRPLADLLVSEEKIPVVRLAKHVAKPSGKRKRAPEPLYDDDEDSSTAQPLLVIDMEGEGDFDEPESDSDLVPPDEDE